MSLEPAMDRLSASRRRCLLRFYRKQTHAGIGEVLAISEEAAKKRVARAMERLREVLRKRGVEAEAMAIGPVLLGNAVSPAPMAVKVVLANVTGGGGGVWERFWVFQKGLSIWRA